MKKIYTMPELEVTLLSAEDILNSSLKNEVIIDASQGF